MAVEIPVRRLARHCNPFGKSPWGVRITRADVRKALAERRLISTPGTDDHAGRIAFLIEHPAADPIEVDVGAPVMGFWTSWMIQDGNHRMAAAMFSGAKVIKADVQGQLDYARRIFGVDCSH